MASLQSEFKFQISSRTPLFLAGLISLGAFSFLTGCAQQKISSSPSFQNGSTDPSAHRDSFPFTETHTAGQRHLEDFTTLSENGNRTPASQNANREPQGDPQRALPSTFTGAELKSAPDSGARIRPINRKMIKGFRYGKCDSLTSTVPDCVSIPSSIPDCFRGDYTCAIEYAYLKFINPKGTQYNDEALVFQCAAWNQTTGCGCPKRYDPNQMVGFVPVRSVPIQNQEGMETRISELSAKFEDRHWYSTFAVVLSRKDAQGVYHYSVPRCTTVAPLQFEFFPGLQKENSWPLQYDTRPLPTDRHSTQE